MIGRAAEGNPWIFRDVIHYLKTGEILPPPTISERIEVAKHHFDLLIKYKGEHRGTLEARKHMSWYFKGVPGGAVLRGYINKAETPSQMLEILDEFLKAYCV